MSRKTIKAILLSSLIFFAGISAYSQDGAYNSYSPYSVFGVGDLIKDGPAYSRSMGGVGIASRNHRFVNYMNPAAVTARDTLSFMMDVGMKSENKIYHQGGYSSANNVFNLNDIVFSVPIYRKSAVMLGITPFSNVGYDFSHYVTDPSIIGNTGNILYSSSGNGGLYQLFFGGGVTLWDNLSLGAEGIYYFGNIDKTTTMSFSNSSYREISSGNILELNAMTAKFGVQYDQKLGNDVSMTLGATYRLGTNIKGYSTEYQFATIASVRDTLNYSLDTLNTSEKARLGDELGVGISIRKGDKWTMEFDYIRSDWTGSHFDVAKGFSNIGTATFSPAVSHSFRAGFEIVPNRNDIRYYMRRCAYRFGAYYDTSYYKLDKTNVNAMGLTFGVTLPVFRWYNGLSLGVDIGQKGSTQGNLTRERYAMFVIGFNIHDIWFQKYRYN